MSPPDFITKLGQQSKTCAQKAFAEYRPEFVASAFYSSALVIAATSPNLMAYMDESFNAWMWKSHPLHGVFNVRLLDTDFQITGTQALIGTAAFAGLFVLLM